ncbi:HlyD family secretion protein [Acinetobacter guillouiae]|uniref:HlyD family secretion protein n=1 Tax=Acinetobacter guillouiae TaxID=106649 RepID=UPI003008E601
MAESQKTVRPWLRVLIAFLIMTGLLSFVFFIYNNWSINKKTQTSDNAYVKGDLTYITSKVSGYVVKVNVVDNQKVEAGQVLVEIDSTDYFSEVDQAKAKIAETIAAQNELGEKIKLAKEQIIISKTEINAAEATLHRVTKYLKRTEDLVNIGAISKSEYDKAVEDQVGQETNVNVAKVKIREAEQNIHVLKAQRGTLNASLNAAQAILVRAENNLKATKMIAPREGMVVSRKVREGEYVSAAKTLMVIAPEKNLWIEANLKETQISKLAKGDQVSFSVDAIPGHEFCGTLESISKSSGSDLALLPADNATGNFTKIVRRFPVKITFDPQQNGLEKLAIGMSVIVGLKANTKDKSCG